MSQNSSDKYIYFSVGLLKNSSALEALRQDALKHHMIDQPGRLIALRLTEYYEMMNEGIVQPVVKVPAMFVPVSEGKEENEQTQQSPANSTPQVNQPTMPVHTAGSNAFIRQLTGKLRALQQNGDNIIATSRDAEQNADDAADYWSTL